MRRVIAAVLGPVLMLASATPSWADAAQFRLPNAPYNGYGQNRGQIGTPRGPGGQRFMRPGGGQRLGGNPGYAGRSFDGRDRGHRGYGPAIGAGVAGLAAGAIVGGALANQGGYYGGRYDRDDGPDYDYAAPVYGAPAYAAPSPYDDVEPASADDPTSCAQRYRSYDPDSQTYLGYDGERHPCP